MSTEVRVRNLRLKLAGGIDVPQPAMLAALPELPKLLVGIGRRVLDLGAGAGLFTLLAAAEGADVLATDVSEAALSLVRENAKLNACDARVATRVSDLWSGLVNNEVFDLVIANLPQTPAPWAGSMSDALKAKWGGEDGTRYLAPMLKGAARRVAEGGGLLMLQIGWLDWRELDRAAASAGFKTQCNLSVGARPFLPSEYDGYAPGLMEYLRARVARGEAEELVAFSSPEGASEAFPFRYRLVTR